MKDGFICMVRISVSGIQDTYGAIRWPKSMIFGIFANILPIGGSIGINLSGILVHMLLGMMF